MQNEHNPTSGGEVELTNKNIIINNRNKIQTKTINNDRFQKQHLTVTKNFNFDSIENNNIPHIPKSKRLSHYATQTKRDNQNKSFENQIVQCLNKNSQESCFYSNQQNKIKSKPINQLIQQRRKISAAKEHDEIKNEIAPINLKTKEI